MTLQQIQDRINTLVNDDNDTPATTDDEWETRLNLINQAIDKWSFSDTLWDELWTTYTHASTLSTATTYAMTMTDLRFPGGQLRLIKSGVTTYIPIISPEEYQGYAGEAQVAYITGNQTAGWTLNLGWTPTSSDSVYGATIKLDYYKYATRYTTASLTSVKPEMSDPNYIIYDVAATKALLDSNNNMYSVFSTEAQACMTNMRITNDIKPSNNADRVVDADAVVYSALMGE